jgi:hypothetical protein
MVERRCLVPAIQLHAVGPHRRAGDPAQRGRAPLASQKGFVVTVPILAGSLLRSVVGVLVDRIGGKRVGLLHLAFVFFPLGLIM